MDQPLLTAVDLSVLHDAELCLVAMDRDAGRLRLGFNMIGSAKLVLSFHGVLGYRIDNIIQQNVVSRVLLSGSCQHVDAEIPRLVRWINSSGTDLLVSKQNLQRHIASVQSGDLRLVYVEPSWGAEIGVLAERMDLLDEPD